MRRLLIAPLALLLVATLMVGCKPSTPTAPVTPTPAPQPPPDTTATPPRLPGEPEKKDNTQVVVVKPETLDKEWQADAAAAKKRYGKRLLEVTGPVQGFALDAFRRPTLRILCGASKKGTLLYVLTQHRVPWALVGVGQVVTVRGKLDPDYVAPHILDAEIVNPKPNTSMTVKAPELAAEWEKDLKVTNEKYEGKSLIVVGKVVKHGESEKVFLQGTDKTPVACQLDQVLGEPLSKSLKEGTEVRIFGRYIGSDPLFEPKEVYLGGCLPIPDDK